MKLLVRNLARTTTEKELASFFAVFGTVQSCHLVLDKATGKSKGFAFVEMPKAGEAKVAMKKMNNKDVAGNKIRVKKAENKTTVVSSDVELESVDALQTEVDEESVPEAKEH
ncbi:RNA recognition motif domain-containing protein [Marinicella litoralis]|uniref:RNA recognition motif-containing protein n=1 Tax=Marinicella litoralis TaxID=644220 RepID=A0A4R6XLJ7_9GAMM|nr:RNA recognition motif-containing protein [Marinicella litoralis]